MRIDLNKIRAYRVYFGFNQEETANMIGICKESYFRKEKGLSEFKVDELIKLAEVFKVSICNFFTE